MYLMLLMQLTLWCGCKDKEILYLYNTKITFPEVNDVSDSVKLSSWIDNDKFKICRYVPESGCIECDLNFVDTQSFVDSLVNAQYVFIICNKKRERILHLLKVNKYPYRVFVDTACLFVRLNKLPKDTQLQTFLLDANDRIVGFGDPIKNQSVKTFYSKVVNKRE